MRGGPGDGAIHVVAVGDAVLVVVVVGAAVILFDPIFQGLALSLMAGELASLLVSRLAVPVLYEMAARKSAAVRLPAPASVRSVVLVQ